MTQQDNGLPDWSRSTFLLTPERGQQLTSLVTIALLALVRGKVRTEDRGQVLSSGIGIPSFDIEFCEIETSVGVVRIDRDGSVQIRHGGISIAAEEPREFLEHHPHHMQRRSMLRLQL